MTMKKMYGKQCGYTGLSQPFLDGEPSEACGLLGLERITLIVLRHRGKYAGCLSRPEYRLDAANAAKNPGV